MFAGADAPKELILMTCGVIVRRNKPALASTPIFNTSEGNSSSRCLGFSVEKQQIYNKAPFIFSNIKDLDFNNTKSKKNILVVIYILKMK